MDKTSRKIIMEKTLKRYNSKSMKRMCNRPRKSQHKYQEETKMSECLQNRLQENKTLTELQILIVKQDMYQSESPH